METKYTDYLKSRGWTEYGFYDPEDEDYVVKLECSTVQLFGYGKSKEPAHVDLEASCKEYVVGIEQALNLELVT